MACEWPSRAQLKSKKNHFIARRQQPLNNRADNSEAAGDFKKDDQNATEAGNRGESRRRSNRRKPLLRIKAMTHANHL